MKNIMKSLVLFFTILCIRAQAQELASKSMVGISWEVALPSGNDYLSEPSFSGWRLEYRQLVRSSMSVGIAMSWNTYDEYADSKTYTSSGGSSAVTTDMIRQLYTVPITLTGHYYPGIKGRPVQPYIGLGLGAQYAQQNTYFNIYEVTEYNWGFVARPEVGILFRLGPSPVRGMLAAGYNIATNKNEAFQQNGMNHFAFTLGVGIGK